MENNQAQSPVEKTPAQKHQIVVHNLLQVVSNTSFQPREFQAAVDMVTFLEGLKGQVDQKVASEQGTPVQAESPAPATA